MALIVQIAPKHECLLGFLFPTHSVLGPNDSISDHCIFHRDIKSPAEKDMLETYYPDSVIISNRIFTEVLTPERLKEMCIEYSHKRLGNRKTKFDVSEDTTAEEYLNFMYGLTTDAEEESITTLFDLAGSSAFISEFIKLSETIPVAKLSSALNTFVNKVLNVREGSSVFYLRKASVLSKKIRQNMQRSIDELLARGEDDQGLSICYFYNSLFM